MGCGWVMLKSGFRIQNNTETMRGGESDGRKAHGISAVCMVLNPRVRNPFKINDLLG